MSIDVNQQGDIAIITLNRPERLNALDLDHLRNLDRVFDMLGCEGSDPLSSSKVAILNGAGRSFCAGADIKAMRRMSATDFAEAASLYSSLAHRTRKLRQPLIAALHGHVLGGGLELACWCDIRIAAHSTQISLPDVELGFSPTGGLTHLLPRIIGLGRAMDLVLSAETIDAAKAEKIGLVTEIVADETLTDTVKQRAQRLASRPKEGISFAKQLLYAATDQYFSDIVAMEESFDNACHQSSAVQLNMAAFERRKP